MSIFRQKTQTDLINNKFNDEQRAELANHARMHGTTKTAPVFSLKWDVDIPESTVRNLRGKMVKRLKFENGKKRKNKMQQKSENEKIAKFYDALISRFTVYFNFISFDIIFKKIRCTLTNLLLPVKSWTFWGQPI